MSHIILVKFQEFCFLKVFVTHSLRVSMFFTTLENLGLRVKYISLIVSKSLEFTI